MPDPNPNLMTIFAEALERTDPAARAAYLDGVCEGNAALRERVEALLVAHDRAGQFLEPSLAVMSDTAAPAHQDTIGTSAPEMNPMPELVTGEHRSPGALTTLNDPAPAELPSRAVAGQVIAGRYTVRDVLGEGVWAQSTGPIRPNLSSGKWPSS